MCTWATCWNNNHSYSQMIYNGCPMRHLSLPEVSLWNYIILHYLTRPAMANTVNEIDLAWVCIEGNDVRFSPWYILIQVALCQAMYLHHILCVCFTGIHDGVIHWERFLLDWPIVRGIHRSLVDSPHKGPVMLGFHVYYDVSLNNL